MKNSTEFNAALEDLVSSQASYNLHRIRYTDSASLTNDNVNMPQLKRHLDTLKLVTVPLLARQLLARLDERITQGQTAVQGAAKDLEDIPQRVIDEDALVRSREQDAKILGDLTNQWNSARSKAASATTDVAVSELAVAPLRPNKNKTNVIIALGVLIGLALGLGLALLLDMTDKRVRYADQVTGGLGLTILGVVPEIRRTKGKQPTVEEAAQVIEAFRTIRLNLAHSIGQGSVVLTISSPSPGDGKSLVTSNLALSFAESGYRTLLIDGDSRRGELHRTFGVDQPSRLA